MARYSDAVCRLCRREGLQLYLKGERCNTPKCAFERRKTPPGIHGSKAVTKKKMSDFGMQLREKQKVRRIYGVMERQLRRYFAEASRRKGLTGATLLSLLESRLDNVVYRMGLADSRNQARQLVRHGHFNVNGHKTDIPSFLVSQGDVVAVRENSRSSIYFKDRMQLVQTSKIPAWMNFDLGAMNGSILNAPAREDVTGVLLNEQLVVEYYSR